jgi:hypothetical protein
MLAVFQLGDGPSFVVVVQMDGSRNMVVGHCEALAVSFILLLKDTFKDAKGHFYRRRLELM